MPKLVFLYVPGTAGPDRPGILLCLGGPEHAAFVRSQILEAAAWLESPETAAVRKALEQAPRVISDGALRPQICSFWAAPAECPQGAAGSPCGPDGTPFDPAVPQGMDDADARRLFGVRFEDCVPSGMDGAGAALAGSVLEIAVQRAPEGFDDAWVEGVLSADVLDRALVPLLGPGGEEDAAAEQEAPRMPAC